MKAVKKLFCLAVSVIMLSGIVITASAANGKVTIRYWNRGSGPDDGINALIEKYNTSQDEVEVVYEFYGENYANIVQMAIAAGDSPDLFAAETGLTVVSLAKNGSIVPVDDLWTDELKTKMHPSTVSRKDLYYQGELYSIPTVINAYRLYYNKDLFRASGLDPDMPPKTLEEMRDFAKRITEAGNGDFYGFALPLGVGQIWERVIDPINIAMGVGDRYGYNSATGKYDFQSNKELFNYYLQLLADGSLFPGYLTLGIDPLRANFSQGKIGMYIDGNWMAGNYAFQLKSTADWSVAPLPVFEGATVGKYWAEAGRELVVGKTNNSEYAKDFLKFYVENQDIINQNMPRPSLLLSANEKDNLPIAELNLSAGTVDALFEVSDLAIPSFEPHKFLTIEGDDRNVTLTNLFAEAAEGKDISEALDTALENLNARYTKALEAAINDGLIDPSDLE